MLRALTAGAWFVWRSWSYLGCDHGTGRWQARRGYFAKIVPKTLWFIRQDIRDGRVGSLEFHPGKRDIAAYE